MNVLKVQIILWEGKHNLNNHPDTAYRKTDNQSNRSYQRRHNGLTQYTENDVIG